MKKSKWHAIFAKIVLNLLISTYLISVSKARKALNADNSLIPNCYHRGDEGLYRSGGWMEQKI